MTVDPDSVVPLFEQIAELLRADIKSGKLPRGRRVPSELSLCQEFDVSRDTVRKSIRLLRDEELVVTRAGKGTFVAELKR